MTNRIPTQPPTGDPTPSAAGDDSVKLPPVPFVTIDEKICIQKLPGLLEATFDTATPPENGLCPLPLLAYFVGAGLPRTVMPLLPVAPDRLFLMAGDPKARSAVMAALAAVEIREPNYGKSGLGRLAIGNHTPLKETFRQMAAVPMTVFSVTYSTTGGSLFFLRTRFTIEAFFEELAKVLRRPPQMPDSQNN